MAEHRTTEHGMAEHRTRGLGYYSADTRKFVHSSDVN